MFMQNKYVFVLAYVWFKRKGKERKSEEGKMVESESFHCLEQS